MESVGALRSTVLIVRHSRVYSHWREHVLIQIVADLAEVVRSKSPQLAPGALAGVVEQDERVVLATCYLHDLHALQGVFDLSWLQDAVSVGVSKTQLALIGVTAAEKFISLRDEDGVAASSLQVFDGFVCEGL